MTTDDVEAVRLRALNALRRAERAAEVAERHERLVEGAAERMRSLHQWMAEKHRMLERRHRTAAAIHTSHADCLVGWVAAGRVEATRPEFIATVAEASGMTSIAITLRSDTRHEAWAVASDRTARVGQDLELIVGEGPLRDATRTRQPAFAVDLHDPGRWPAYRTEACEFGVHSVVAAPLMSDSGCIGAMAAYNVDVEHFDLPHFEHVLATMTEAVLEIPGMPPEEGLVPFGNSERHAVVHLATGMIAARRGCNVADAFAILRAKAFADSETLEIVARQVVDRKVILD